MSMGEGGVACMPSQHVMERIPVSDTTYCRGNGGGFSSKSIQFTEQQLERKQHDKKMTLVEKEDFGSENEVKEGEVENGEIVADRSQQKDEVEEGEVGEFIPEKPRRREVENEAFLHGKWRRGGGEFVPDKRQKWERTEFHSGRRLVSEVEKGEFIPDKPRKKEVDKLDSFSGKRGQRELERGEGQYKSRKEGQEVYSSSKGPKRDIERDEFAKGWVHDRKEEDAYQRKDLSRSSSEFTKRYTRWDPGHSRDTKIGFRTSDDELGLLKREAYDGKSYNKDYSVSWQKRQSTNSGSNGRRYHDELLDVSNSKSRRIYEDINRGGFFDDKSYRNTSSSRYASKHYDSSVSRRSHDRHGPNPGYLERSPHDRGRHHDHRGRSPVSERSPNDQARYYDHRNRSPSRRSPYRSRPNDRRDCSPGYLDRSPLGRGRSPHVRARYHDRRDRTPGYLENSSQDFIRSPRHDCRDNTPGYLDRSPPDYGRSPYLQTRHNNCREHTPGHLERSPHDRGRSPHDRGRSHDYHEDSHTRKGREDENILVGELDGEYNIGSVDSTKIDPNDHSSTRPSQFSDIINKGSISLEVNTNDESLKEEKCLDPSQVSGIAEEVSMEEDMDISNTPPHVPAVDDSALGTWFYLDNFGIEQGTSKLCNLKRLVEEGVLQSDHLIKHSASNWWVTVENAVSPPASMKFPPIVSDTVSQLVSPPEAPGNLLEDIADPGESTRQVDEEPTAATCQIQLHSDASLIPHEPFEDLHIDDRVNALLNGYAIIPGRELETLGEALHMAFEHTEWEKWGNSEGFTRSRSCTWEPFSQGNYEECNRSLEITSKEVVETKSVAPCKKDCTFRNCNPSDWFSGRWSCKGGDWKRNDDANQEKSSRRKFVLNDGYPLCQMPKSLYEDPRWCRKDELYYPSHSRKLNLPSWAFSVTEGRIDCNGTSRSNQLKNSLETWAVRGAKGSILPVVRINACVVNNQVSAPEFRAAGKAIDRLSTKSNRTLPSSNDGRSLSAEGASGSKRAGEQKFIVPITPRDRVCTVEDLQLHLGDWYYIDGAGHEHRYSSLIELQALVEKGTIQKHTSVFRKLDNIWVPVSYVALGSKSSVQTQEAVAKVTESSAASSSHSEVSIHDLTSVCSSSFHQQHPQFIGYTRGKLHELVMKSYKSREFAAAINEVLDPWINAKQPKKDLELILKSRRSDDDHIRTGKRARMAMDDSDDDYDMEYGAPKDDCLFDNLLNDAIFSQETYAGSEVNMESWGLLNRFILGRVFHFLRADNKSLAFSAATCRHWNLAVNFYRGISKQVDMSEAGSDCTDSMFHNIMNCYKNSKIASIILVGCTNISANALEEIILSFPCISSIDIRGCTQFRELTHRYQNIKWFNSRSSRETKSEDSHSKIKSLKQITDKGPTFSRAFKGSSSYLNEYREGDFLQNNSSLDGRDSTSRSFRQSFYQRKKLLDSRKSASLLSREARMRHFYYRKSENGFKRMEEFLAFILKEIMKENTFDFFVPKVAEIEDKMKNGYYRSRGLNSVREDVIRICRDAKKAKSRGDTRDMNHIIMLFLRLATSLVQDPKESSRGKDELLKMLKERSKKKQIRQMNERKSINKSNDSSFFNGGADYGEYASDREVRRKLSKLNKRPLDSESETSDDINQSEGTEDDSESTVSDRESYMDVHSDGGMRNGYFMDEEDFESTVEDREWGARMTKASLVPPVTRKYEVIERYLIIADEEEVRRKMQVSLPENYAEKLNVQKNGVEDADLDFPEVKDYKPRKQVGEEVLEQEVYGIDPYTHNLLLDSMPEELDWALLEKHLFIEDTLLRVLNMQVRRFTGTGNAPMKYPLQPVVEEILTKSEADCDKRLMKMCNAILKAMRSRPEDNYVAYRKGLGVVCNKEEGFTGDDFVVEFLGEVYPAWKWFEKQDGIRSLQKDNKDPAPEFYNIYLERPKGDRDGYDLVVVDAMHKANYASRICHSCRPNCEAKVTAVDGQYQIGVYTVRPIGYAEEITFDYNSVTESKEEYEASVCLCGSQICRGSYLNLTGEGAFQKVLMECHGILDRHRLMLEACESNVVSEEDYNDLGRAGLGTCLLAGLPVWLVAYSARLVRFINFERTKLPEEILRHNLEEKRKFSLNINIDDEKNDAEVQAEGVYGQRLQNLALTLDKVRYVTRSIFHDPMQAPPPLKKLSPEEVVSVLWKGEGSLIEELLECMTPHTEEIVLTDLRSKILDHDPSGSDNLMEELQKSLLWLRDEIRSLPCTYKCRHDAAADLIHIYAYTKYFFRVQEYKTITSPPVFISPLDLGPKYADKLGSGFMEYCKKYGENYCLGQLIYWHTQNNIDPDCCLVSARRGCLSLPEITSFYAKANKPSRQRVYGPKTIRLMLSRMEKQSQRAWPNDKIWSFNSGTQVFGSPMLDAVVNKSSALNREMVHWLKNRSTIFQAKWDR